MLLNIHAICTGDIYRSIGAKQEKLRRRRKIGKIGGHDASHTAASQRQYMNKYIILYFYGVQGAKPPEAIRF